MCIIAYAPKGIEISKEHLKNSWEGNSHGAGIMYAHQGKVIVKKEMTSFETFYNYYLEALELDVNIVMHFRISTSGGINLQNVHPFKVNKGLYFCHNGVLDITVPKDSPINDTQIFNNQLLKNLPDGFLFNDGIMSLIGYAIGTSKFVFLDKYGNVKIVNERLGEWNEGAWFSNTSYKWSRSSYVSKYTGSSYYRNRYDGWGTTYADFDNDDWYEDNNVGRYPAPAVTKDYDYCPCCSESVKISDLKYINDFNMEMCPKCLKWAKEDYGVEDKSITVSRTIKDAKPF